MRPYHGHGISLGPEHFQDVLEGALAVPWVEMVSERFLDARGGRRRRVLETVRRDHPVALHGTTLSIGSVDPLDAGYLDRLGALVRHVEPVWVSDHLAWSSFDGRELDLLPLPYTEECLDHVLARVAAVQDRLGSTPLLLENPASCLEFTVSEMTESEFLAAVAQRSGCGILLDVNNLVISATNQGFDPARYLAALPGDHVLEVHLAGHRDAGGLVVDTHEGPVPAEVWDLYRETVRRFGPISTILEWDTRVPPLAVLLDECDKAAALAGGAP